MLKLVRLNLRLRKREPSPEEQLQLVQQIRSDLSQKYKPEDLSPDGDEYQQRQYKKTRFMAKWQVKEILTRERLRPLIEHYPWYRDIKLEEWWDDYCCVIATLITFDWNMWAEFHSRFIVNKLANKALPIPEVELDFMTIANREAFTQLQHIYCPVVFTEDQNIKYSPDARLPFVRSAKIKVGGFGKIYGVIIDKHQTRYIRPQPHESAETVEMALKLIEKRESWERECLVQEILKHCSSRHESIVLSFASFEKGKRLGILYPLAAFNLAEFFQGTHPSYTQRVGRFELQDLYQQYFNLAGAFRFIHKDLCHKNGVEYTCFHHDFKPDNVMIYLNHSDSSVGDWKVIDFGLSTMSTHTGQSGALILSAGSAVLQSNASSNVDPPRASGPYQGPEMCDGGRVGRPADMWSFGTVLAEGIAWGLGGPPSVISLSLARHTEGDGRFWSLDAESTPRLHPSVDKWITDIEDAHSTGPQYLLKSLRLVRGLLDINKDSRLNADETWELMKVIQKAAVDARFLWQVTKSSPEPGSPVQPLQKRLSVSTETGPNSVAGPDRVRGVRARFRQSKLGRLLSSRAAVEQRGEVTALIAAPSAVHAASYRPDPPINTQICCVDVPPGTVQAVIGADTQLAAFRSEQVVYFYDAHKLATQDCYWNPWPESPVSVNVPKVPILALIRAPENQIWESVEIAGNFVAGTCVGLDHCERVSRRSFGLFVNLEPGLLT
jgi:serine/threonine protein kinase